MEKDQLVLVTGAGGFIGGHLVGDLLTQGYTNLRAVDIKPLSDWFQLFPEADSRQLDLRLRSDCSEAAGGAEWIFNLAADMGGMGFIEFNKALCMMSVLINTHLLLAAREHGASRSLFASSACVYAAEKQERTENSGLKESDAYPAMPEDGYGWEKLFSERMCRHFYEDFGLETRVARYHNVYGPHGTFDGGREKAPAAICRKMIEAQPSGSSEIEIWGDGEQTRSFTFIDDGIHGTNLLMTSTVTEPLNVGSSQLVTINKLVDIVEEIAGVKLRHRYKPDAPQGVRGRNSDNRLIRKRLGWEPKITLEEGLERTYRWISDQMKSPARTRTAAMA